MEKVFVSLGGSVAFLGGIFFLVLLRTLVGGIAGWTVGLVFGDTILGIAAQLGVKGVSMSDFGVFLGFVGGFLSTRTTVEKE